MRKVIPLNVAGAYHSRLMEPARAAFAAFLADIAFARPGLTVFTNTTGGPVAEPGRDPRGAGQTGGLAGAVGGLHAPAPRPPAPRNSGSSARAASSPAWRGAPNRGWPVRSFAEFADFAA